jgi:hypothetical protein
MANSSFCPCAFPEHFIGPLSLPVDQIPSCLDLPETLIIAKILLFLRVCSMGYFNPKIGGKTNANT